MNKKNIEKKKPSFDIPKTCVGEQCKTKESIWLLGSQQKSRKHISTKEINKQETVKIDYLCMVIYRK